MTWCLILHDIVYLTLQLDCILTKWAETSQEIQRGTMGWITECSNRSCWAGHYLPCLAGWVGLTVLLYIDCFCSMMRPAEPFMAVFLT